MEHRIWHDHYEMGVPTDVVWDSVPLDHLLARAATAWPDQPALVFFDHALTFSELNAVVDRLAAGLQRLGVGPGDRVSVYMPNCPQIVMAYEAIWRAGAIAVPSNPMYTAAEFAHQTADAGSKVAIVLSMLYDNVQRARADTSLEHVIVTNIKEYFSGTLRFLFTLTRERKGGHKVDIANEPGTHEWNDVLDDGPPTPVEVDPADPAMLMYTGGTTGVPKGAVLSHDNLHVNAHQVAGFAPELIEGVEVLLTALPLTHSYSVTVGMNHAMAKGYTQLLIPDPRDLVGLLKVIDHHKPTVFPGVPTLYAALSNHRHVKNGKYSMESINFCISGAAPLPPETQRRFQEVTGSKLVEGYGLSEASPVTHCNPLRGEDHIGTIGVPLPGTDAKIVDEDTETTPVGVGERGILCVAGPQVMSRYWNRADETEATLREDEHGTVWLHTGDVAVMEPNGFFKVVDRKKDMILAGGGLNVYPREVEDVLFEHPAVLEAGVIGVPVGAQDQRVKAFVVVEPGSGTSAEDLIEFCRERLAKYKVPRTVEFREELPKTFVGKILRRQLSEEELVRQTDPSTG